MLKKLLKEIVFRIRGDYTIEKLKKLGLRVGSKFNPQKGYMLDPSHCWLIQIGDNVTFGPNVSILAHDASTHIFLGYTKIGKVNIGSNVFIGEGSIVLPNVSIGDNVVVGANSTITKDIPSGSVYAGNPAKYICSIEDYLDKHLNLMKSRPCYEESYTLRLNVSDKKKAEMIEALDDGIGYVV